MVAALKINLIKSNDCRDICKFINPTLGFGGKNKRSNIFIVFHDKLAVMGVESSQARSGFLVA